MTKQKKISKQEKVEVIEPTIIEKAIEEEVIDLEEEIKKPKKEAPKKQEKIEAPKPKVAKKNDSFKNKLFSSSIIKRVSPSTLTTIFCMFDNQEDIIKEVIKNFATAATACTPQEFKEITTDLNKLID